MDITISIPRINIPPHVLCPLILVLVLFLYSLYKLGRALCGFIRPIGVRARRFFQYKFLFRSTSYYEVLVIFVYIIYNVGFLVVDSWEIFDQRCRWISLSNLFLCSLTGNPYFKRFGYGTSSYIHITSATLALATASFHLFHSWTVDLKAVLSISIIGLLMLSPLLRARFHKLFIVLHNALALSTPALVSLHIGYNSPTKVAFNCAFISCVLGSHMVRGIMILYHRYYSHSGCTRLESHPKWDREKLEDAVCLSIKIRRPMAKTGQYFHLKFPSQSLFQSYPLFPAWSTETHM